MNKEVLIDIRNLKKYFPIKNFFGTSTGNIKAVDDVSFHPNFSGTVYFSL